MAKVEWKASDQTDAKYLGYQEWQDDKGEWQHFEIMELPDRLLFGGACNVGFLESGYILKETDEPLHKTLEELLADLEVYYNDGPRYVSRIVCNERM